MGQLASLCLSSVLSLPRPAGSTRWHFEEMLSILFNSNVTLVVSLPLIAKCMGVTMRCQIVVALICGLHSSLLTVYAQECEEGENAWNNLKVQVINTQEVGNQSHTEITVRLKQGN